MAGFNFNNNANEYALHGSATAEMIELYGLQVTYIKMTKVNSDRLLSEYQFMRADNDSVYKVMVYPENTGTYNDQNDLLSKFGLLMNDSTPLFISRKYMDIIHEDGNYHHSVGDVIMMPSGQLFEVTELEAQVPGLNNMFTYNNTKNVFLLKTRAYTYNHDQVNITDDPDIPDFDNLFGIETIAEEKAVQEAESKIVKNLDPVFGDLG